MRRILRLASKALICKASGGFRRQIRFFSSENSFSSLFQTPVNDFIAQIQVLHLMLFAIALYSLAHFHAISIARFLKKSSQKLDIAQV